MVKIAVALPDAKFFLYEIAAHMESIGGGDFKQIMRDRYAIELTDKQVAQIKAKLNGKGKP